ncbi:MAG: putative transposase, partial [Gammaproteobacteria bacterium]
AMDAATRVILGFAICSAPNEQSALEAMRSCYSDKTYLLRAAGNEKDSWNYSVRHQMTVSDSGSEFGANPFGGSRFVEACRVLACSLMNTTAGVSELRGQIERLFLTFDLKFARKISGWTTGSASTLGDRKPATHACLTDDDLLDAFVGYVADYHATAHRGLDGKSPATAWKEMSQTREFDDETPGPAALRLACGFYVDVTISDNGIRYAGNSYSNAFIRDQRMAPLAERIDGKDKKIQAMVDPFDLGGITVFDNGEPISIPCIDETMRGKSLRAWSAERALTRSEARADSEQMAERRQSANGVWKDVVARAAQVADVGMSGYTKKEVERAALEIGFGKGHHEKSFISRAEYEDPMSRGVSARRQTEIQDSSDEVETGVPSIVDAPNSMDRFRSKLTPKSRRKNKK